MCIRAEGAVSHLYERQGGREFVLKFYACGVTHSETLQSLT